MYKYFYKFPKDYENEYQKRLESPTAEVLDFKIKPYKHNEYFNLYYVPTSEILNLVYSIEKNNSNLMKLTNNLPNVATESLHQDIIVNELYSTNQIEGIKSNKQEIVRSVRELKENPKKIKGVCVYYFDTKDNILLIEIYGQNENIINRHYYFHTVNQIKSIYFNSGYQSIRNIDLLKCKNGQVMEVLNYGEMGSSISNYIYDSGKLIEIDIKQKEHNKNEIAKYKVYFEYKDDILNRIVDKHPNGYEEQRYP